METLYTFREVAEQGLIGYKIDMIRVFAKRYETGDTATGLRTIDVSDPDSLKRVMRVPESAIEEFLEKRVR